MEGPTPRIIKQTTLLLKEPAPGITFTPDPNNCRHYFASIEGPEGTCFQGGIFKTELLLPTDYPLSPPKVVFETKIYHPNIGIVRIIEDNLGRICLDILKKSWSPALQMRSVLLSIQCLLSDPNPQDPLNNEAAALWKSSKVEAESFAREWTLKYAK